MVSDSEMVAMESQSLFRMVPFLTPMTSPSTEWWFQIIKCTQGLISRRVLPLGDYITEDIDKTSFAYNRCAERCRLLPNYFGLVELSDALNNRLLRARITINGV